MEKRIFNDKINIMKKDFWRKMISYIFPLSYVYDSDYSEELEVHYWRGKKMLNTKNANYSYDSLQKVLETGLKKISLENVKTTLLLGMGGGSIIHSLYNKFLYQGHVTAVEIDPAVVQIADEEFEIYPDEDLTIICEDALKFVVNQKDKFDLIIVDLFIDTQVPSPFYQADFWKNVIQLLNANGQILFNAGMGLKNQQLNSFLKNLPKEISYQIMENVVINTLVVMKKVN